MKNGVASPEQEIIQKVVAWLKEAGWHAASEKQVDSTSRARHDAIIDTGKGLVIIDAKSRGRESGRVAIEAYPAGYRIFLAQQPGGDWRIRTESNTYDPRPLTAETTKQILLEMLGQA